MAFSVQNMRTIRCKKLSPETDEDLLNWVCPLWGICTVESVGRKSVSRQKCVCVPLRYAFVGSILVFSMGDDGVTVTFSGTE